jgi:aerobic-type carbon monoxide dehydrogenase small subunit (CoxS/CutS family)
MIEHSVELVVNERPTAVKVRTGDTLLHTLREELGLKSVRGTCGIGICGTCTVLVNGLPVSSCNALTVMHSGTSITTSEGLVHDGELDAVQRAFIDEGAYQCSYCIPAMVLTVRSLLDQQADLGPDSIREQLAGNLCRCGTYPRIMAAVESLIADRDGLGGNSGRRDRADT